MEAMRVRTTLLPWRPFTEEEMRITMSTWKNRRATGVDGVAQEALRAMFNDPGWKPCIAELLNDCFYRGEISEWISKGASVLLPKTLVPATWAETRPITFSNALVKWLAQLLLLRENPLLEACCHRQ